MDINNMIEVLQALKEGKVIQYRRSTPNRLAQRSWNDRPINSTHLLNFGAYDYRVKPPSPREYWLLKRKSSDNVMASYLSRSSAHNAYSLCNTEDSDAWELIHVKEVPKE